MKRLLVAFFCGVLFSIGLAVGGMTHPTKVLGFLDLLTDWDPSLMFVMAGGLAINVVAFRFILRRKAPLLAPTFDVPRRTQIDLPLIAGSALFGAGWGLAGYCPGPALAGIGNGAASAILFVGSMIGGIMLHELVFARAPAPVKAEARSPSRIG